MDARVRQESVAPGADGARGSTRRARPRCLLPPPPRARSDRTPRIGRGENVARTPYGHGPARCSLRATTSRSWSGCVGSATARRSWRRPGWSPTAATGRRAVAGRPGTGSCTTGSSCWPEAAGGAERALEITVGYAKERKPFDTPAGRVRARVHPTPESIVATASRGTSRSLTSVRDRSGQLESPGVPRLPPGRWTDGTPSPTSRRLYGR